MEVEFVLEDAVARVEEVFEIVSVCELIARVLVGYTKMRLLVNKMLLSLLFDRMRKMPLLDKNWLLSLPFDLMSLVLARTVSFVRCETFFD